MLDVRAQMMPNENSRSGNTVQHTDKVREIVNDRQVVLNHNDEVAGVKQRADDATARE
jgi:hypothetical protein